MFRRKMAGHHRSTTGGAHAACHHKVMEIHTFLRQPIDVWCSYIGVPVTTKIAPAPVIGKDEKDVWFLIGNTQGSDADHNKHYCQNYYCLALD
jgi:hypothetical protein